MRKNQGKLAGLEVVQGLEVDADQEVDLEAAQEVVQGLTVEAEGTEGLKASLKVQGSPEVGLSVHGSPDPDLAPAQMIEVMVTNMMMIYAFVYC